MGAGTIIDRTNKGVGITPESADHGTKSEFLKNWLRIIKTSGYKIDDR